MEGGGGRWELGEGRWNSEEVPGWRRCLDGGEGQAGPGRGAEGAGLEGREEAGGTWERGGDRRLHTTCLWNHSLQRISLEPQFATYTWNRRLHNSFPLEPKFAYQPQSAAHIVGTTLCHLFFGTAVCITLTFGTAVCYQPRFATHIFGATVCHLSLEPWFA